MLYRLEVENFWSIRDTQVVDLTVRAGADDRDGRLAPIWRGADARAPKVTAFFGANASGKSNLLKAPAFLAWFLQHSFTNPRGAPLPFERFNEAEALRAPTRIAAHLGGIEDISRINDPTAPFCEYVYEVWLGGDQSVSVLGESLHYRPADSVRQVKLFKRQADGTIEAGKAFGLAGYRQALNKVLRPDASAIATLAQLDHPYAKLAVEWAAHTIVNILTEKSDLTDRGALKLYTDFPWFVDNFNKDAQRLDFGVNSMKILSGPDGPFPIYEHSGLHRPMLHHQESHGTRQFIKLYPLLLSALTRGGVAIFDELDAAIHPMILPEIVRWFHDPERNPHDAQLWMTCHNASLLEDLSKDEVFFCDKDARGRTAVYGLRDVTGIKRQDNFYKKYLGGSFGAVPQIG
ncbi:AAA family ATPase [Methylobacterium sp. A54F]